jgi:60 kDa SS-A/Ro ribonucleoprotein
MKTLATHLQSTQQEQAHPKQQKNNAGGYAFTVDDWARLDRFLVLGSGGGTYYVGERKLTRDNAKCVERCLDADGPRAVERIAHMSESGRTPKQGPPIFALALACAHKDQATRALALRAVSRVCRTGTHLFQFLAECRQLRGWGRGLRKCVEHWYKDKTADKLAYQLVKYQQREGWSHRDAMRLCHGLQGVTPQHDAAIKWALGKKVDELPMLLAAFERAKETPEPELCTLIREYRMTREMLPTEALKSPKVWEAMLPHMPMGALVRNLGVMTANGLLKPISNAVPTVCAKLTDGAALTKARVHPVAVLSALAVYRTGHGARGKLSWEPVPQICDALDEAFYLSFGAVKPTGKRTLLALDVSRSMGGGIGGLPGLTARDASAAMAMVTARTEPTWHAMAFAHDFVPLNISPRQRLDDVVRTVSGLQFGATDCALPMLWAQATSTPVDAFFVYTDSETWFGTVHPHEALEKYRRSSGIDAKLVVVGMTATEFTIANPDDAGMLDVVGFDTAAPNVMSDFVRGEAASE